MISPHGPKYEFTFDSQNGADILIVISKWNYAGEVTRRHLGRAPVLKRENSDHIYGTSLEIYAECIVDGEFAEFYTSVPNEYMVQVYKDNSLLWRGFISPELYSEPDIAPPYDVQIIATDGLGELKNYSFEASGQKSLGAFLADMLNKSGLRLDLDIVSDLQYVKASGELSNSSSDLMNIIVNLDHEKGESCYDVLQRLLASLNMNITQHNERWLLFRDTDFINLASADGVIAYTPSAERIDLPIGQFGSMNSCDWWPIGQMSTTIEPAKKNLKVEAQNHYKDNALSGVDWIMVNGASYDHEEGAYVLPDEGSCIVQKMEFADDEVGFRLGLRVSARNAGTGSDAQSLGIMVKVDGHVYSGYYDFWLRESEPGVHGWINNEAWIERELDIPVSSATAADAQDVDIIIPLYDSRKPNWNTTSWIYARSIEVTILNPAGLHDIYVYGVSLNKYEQFEGYQADVQINNGARGDGDDVTMSLIGGDTVPLGAAAFMTGFPIEYPNTVITQWAVGDDAPNDLLSTIAKDYAKALALPRMSYRGKINVPRTAIPVLFVRDNTYYFPRTYSYNLLNDELEVDLISIPAADVTASSVVVSQISQSKGSFSSTGSGGGSGSGSGGGAGTGSDLWNLDSDGNIVTDRKVTINNSLVVEGDVSSGEEEGGNAVLSITGIKLNGTTYYDTDGDGIIDLGTIISGGGGLTSVSWNDIQGKPTSLSAFANDVGFITAASLAGYLPISGGTITGGINVLRIKREGSRSSVITYENADGVLGIMGLSSDTKEPFFYKTVDGTGTKYNILHSENIKSYNAGGLVTPYINSTSVPNTVNALRFVSNIPNSFASWCTGYNNAVINIGRIGSEGYSTQLGFSGGGMYYRHQNGGTWGDWKTIAFLDSKVANASALDGKKLFSGGEGIVHVTKDGVLEIGQYIDFHVGDIGGDYSTRIKAPAVTSPNFIHLPSATGTLALTTDNVASATKLQTARSLWGQSFDGTADIGGNLTINNGSNIMGKHTNGSSVALVGIGSNNSAYFGYGTIEKSANTYVDGLNIFLRYGASRAVGFTLDSNGNAIFEKNVVVKGDIASA